jgi:hypothetical protein
MIVNEIERRLIAAAERLEERLKTREQEIDHRENVLIERLDAWTRQRQEVDEALREQLTALSESLADFGRRLTASEQQLSAASRR